MGVGRREAKEGEDICINIADSSVVQQKLTQHCKAITLQINKLPVMRNIFLKYSPIGISITISSL